MNTEKDNSKNDELEQSTENQAYAYNNNARYTSKGEFFAAFSKALDDLVKEEETRIRTPDDTFSPAEERFSALLKEAIHRSGFDPASVFDDYDINYDDIDPDFNFDDLPTDEEMKEILSPEEYEQFINMTIDYSFMKQSPLSSAEPSPFPFPSPPKKRLPFFRVPRVAAIFLCFTVAVLGTSIWLNSDSAIATKQRLNAFVGNFSSEESFEGERVDTIHSMDDLNTILKVVPDLCVLGYIPEGFNLEILSVEKFTQNDYCATYRFQRDELNIIINIQKASNESIIATDILDGNLIELPDRTMLVWDNPNTNKYGVSVARGQFLILITGSISQDEMILVAEGLRF